ncbi:MAG TPA: hypothetical protein VGS16_03285 [Candidatus Dormibacteraeota bacterium]|nr:hypothetical protein [Candidatus Dormibacteraeota bacterium]
MIESIFEPAGEGLFVATEAALGPWSDQAPARRPADDVDGS